MLPLEDAPAQKRGFFLSLEGAEGSGKSTQAEHLYHRLAAVGYQALLVHEPGSTPLGWVIRDLVKSWKDMTSAAELALFIAARAELVKKVIMPELQRGTIIVADRYIDSTEAYQGYGRRLPLEIVRSLNNLATEGLKPDLTILLDIDPKEGLRRIGKVQLSLQESPPHFGRADREGERRFEEEPLAFHRRVRQGYLAVARKEPERVVVIDGALSREEVSGLIWGKVAALVGLEA